jgi:hypothetical protein
MPRHQTPAQRETVERVMHEFKHGELKTARGTRKVKNPKQAVAIALSEAGASKYDTPAERARNLRRSKEKERRGETYRDEAEGKKSRSKAAASGTSTRKAPTRKTATGKTSTRKAPARKTAGRKTVRAASSRSAAARKATARRTTARTRTSSRARTGERTKAELYAEAKRRNIPSRSKMDKAQLERALHAH